MCVCVCIYKCTYIRKETTKVLCVCVCVYIYIYLHTHTHTRAYVHTVKESDL